RTRAVVVVADREDHDGGLEDAADALRREGVPLLAVRVRTERGGATPVFRSRQRAGYQTGAAGERVVTRREAAARRPIAGGAERYEAYAERYQWPLALAVLLLLAERLLALRRVEARERESVGA